MSDLSKYDCRYGKYISINLATPKDAQQIFNAQVSAFPEDLSNLSVDEIRSATEDAEHSIYVATYKGVFSGYFALQCKKLRPWVSGNALVVLKEYSGRSVGTYLMQKGISNSKRPFMRIFVEKQNAKALRLYNRLGFFKMGQKTNHYENGDDAIIMGIFTW